MSFCVLEMLEGNEPVFSSYMDQIDIELYHSFAVQDEKNFIGQSSVSASILARLNIRLRIRVRDEEARKVDGVIGAAWISSLFNAF
mgnify:CR=1 FL=1